MAFITGQTNRRIGRKAPSEYLKEIVEKQGQGALKAQRVPTNLTSLTTENYRKFLATRRKALADCMNAFIEKMSSG
jgi:hypothetical protein